MFVNNYTDPSLATILWRKKKLNSTNRMTKEQRMTRKSNK